MIYDDGELSLKELREIDWCGRWKVYPMCAITQEARIRGCGLLVADMIVPIVWYSFSSCSFSSSIFLWLKTFLPFDKKREKAPFLYDIYKTWRNESLNEKMCSVKFAGCVIVSSFLFPSSLFFKYPIFHVLNRRVMSYKIYTRQDERRLSWISCVWLAAGGRSSANWICPAQAIFHHPHKLATHIDITKAFSLSL